MGDHVRLVNPVKEQFTTCPHCGAAARRLQLNRYQCLYCRLSFVDRRMELLTIPPREEK